MICESCHKRFDAWIELKEVHNPDILNHFQQCIKCYFSDVKIRDLQDRIETQHWKIKEAKKNIKFYKSNLLVLQKELADLEYQKYGVI